VLFEGTGIPMRTGEIITVAWCEPDERRSADFVGLARRAAGHRPTDFPASAPTSLTPDVAHIEVTRTAA
jgi:hypothetical protein